METIGVAGVVGLPPHIALCDCVSILLAVFYAPSSMLTGLASVRS
jgi:hypothetical protein